jgi:hypothetical protein
MTRMKKKMWLQLEWKLNDWARLKNKNNKTLAIIRKYDRKWMMKKEKRNNWIKEEMRNELKTK